MGENTNFLGIGGQTIGRGTMSLDIVAVGRYGDGPANARISLAYTVEVLRPVLRKLLAQGYLKDVRSIKRPGSEARKLDGWRGLLEGDNLFWWLMDKKNSSVREDPEELMHKAFSAIQLELDIPLKGEDRSTIWGRIRSFFTKEGDVEAFIVRQSDNAKLVYSRLLGESPEQRAQRENAEMIAKKQAEANDSLVDKLLRVGGVLLGKTEKDVSKALHEGGDSVGLPAADFVKILAEATKRNISLN